MDKTIMLMDLVKERLLEHKDDLQKYADWKAENPKKDSFMYGGKMGTTPTEIKRLLLVLRQETLRFEKRL